jgi:hypothetical protein
VNIDGKSSTMLLLFSLADGACLAAIEATGLGQIRTAAMTGLGTRWLSDENVTEMAIIGTGKQALPQVAACIAVRPISKVRIFSRTPEKHWLTLLNLNFLKLMLLIVQRLKTLPKIFYLLTCVPIQRCRSLAQRWRLRARISMLSGLSFHLALNLRVMYFSGVQL